MGTSTTQQNAEAAAPIGADGISNTTAASDVDHPEGDAIRRQVDFYFSDENLPGDLHLLKCCGGTKNEPVSISRICGFKKMRDYKPRTLVVAALRKSTFLEVSADGKTIKRKVPLQGKCALDPDYFEADTDVAFDPRTRKPAVFPVQRLPQKKTVYPEGTSKNMLKPTGFESTYVEPPMKQEEAVEEEKMYDPDKSFVERIEIAIQRFKQKRRMHEMYSLVFNKLMRFGGVESSPRMHQGLSAQEMKSMDAEEIAQARATHNVPWDRADEKKWVVDFEGLAKAFLSSWYPAHYGYSANGVKNACQVPRSFYNYLRYHKVCPEYDTQLEKALKVCDLAEQELNKVHPAGLALPGDFNKSASVVFGGAQAGMYAGDKSWAEDMKKEGMPVADVGIRDEEASIKFNTGVAIMGSDEQCDMLEVNQLKILQQITTGLEVVNIQPPTKFTKDLYEKQSKVVENKLNRLEALGKLICKTWYAEDYDEWDLPKDKYPNGVPQRASAGHDYEFWVEESVLEECFVGMKMDAIILKLYGGITILDEVRETMCSFFTWLPNELWMDRKPKEVRWLKKGLPGADDNDDEAEAGGSQEFDDECGGQENVHG